jgi:hypothetical protein
LQEKYANQKKMEASSQCCALRWSFAIRKTPHLEKMAVREGKFRAKSGEFRVKVRENSLFFSGSCHMEKVYHTGKGKVNPGPSGGQGSENPVNL